MSKHILNRREFLRSAGSTTAAVIAVAAAHDHPGQQPRLGHDARAISARTRPRCCCG